MSDQLFHRRNLPHLHPSQGTFFITYRLKDSLPNEVIERLYNEYKNDDETVIIQPNQHSYFIAFDVYMDKYDSPKNYLLIPEIAEVNKQAIHYYDSKYYQLICYCIMSNHIHLVIKLTEEAPDLSKIMHSIKRYTAKESNILLNREGAFWAQESYDHLIRSYNELKNTVSYVVNNPVKVGLVKEWDRWPHTYLREDFL